MDNSNTHILTYQKSPTHSSKNFCLHWCCTDICRNWQLHLILLSWTAGITEFLTELLCHPVTVWDRLQFWILYWLNEVLMLHFSNYCSQWTGSTRPFRKKQKNQILYFIIELSRKVSGFPLYFFPCQFENAFQLDSLTRTCNIFFLQFLGW